MSLLVIVSMIFSIFGVDADPAEYLESEIGVSDYYIESPEFFGNIDIFDDYEATSGIAFIYDNCNDSGMAGNEQKYGKMILNYLNDKYGYVASTDITIIVSTGGMYAAGDHLDYLFNYQWNESGLYGEEHFSLPYANEMYVCDSGYSCTGDVHDYSRIFN